MCEVIMSEIVRVETKSAWLSKINWTQMVSFTASALVLITGGKLDIPPEQQAVIVLMIQGAQSMVTWILKTWFTPTITPSSAASSLKTITLD
jgi:hypothetical protein